MVSHKIIFFICFVALISPCCLFEVHGQPWNAQEKCWEPSRAAGHSAQTGADDAETYATDASGRAWRFKNSIIPDDFVDGVKAEGYLEITYSRVDCPWRRWISNEGAIARGDPRTPPASLW